MPKFLVKASYTAEGAKGIQSAGGSARRDAVARLAESLGGRLESFYFAFGETDAFVVLDLPDNLVNVDLLAYGLFTAKHCAQALNDFIGTVTLIDNIL